MWPQAGHGKSRADPQKPARMSHGGEHASRSRGGGNGGAGGGTSSVVLEAVRKKRGHRCGTRRCLRRRARRRTTEIATTVDERRGTTLARRRRWGGRGGTALRSAMKHGGRVAQWSAAAQALSRCTLTVARASAWDAATARQHSREGKKELGSSMGPRGSRM